MQLVLDNLACTRGDRHLFSELSARVSAGEGLLVEGPNGAGKTTLLKTIAGLLAPSAGAVALEDGAADTALAEQCHLIGHLSGVKATLSVAENTAFWSAYLGGGGSAGARARLSLERMELDHLADLPAGVLSAGQRRRLGLARLLAAPRPLWLLDEPAEALDAASQALLGRLIGEHLAADGIVVAVSHAPLEWPLAQSLVLGGGPGDGRGRAGA